MQELESPESMCIPVDNVITIFLEKSENVIFKPSHTEQVRKRREVEDKQEEIRKAAAKRF